MLARLPIILLLVVIATSIQAFSKENDYKIVYDRMTKSNVFVFKTSRGDVQFNHSLHQANMKGDSCFPCHKTENPTSETTMTKLEERKAHYFCKGCHHKLGRGPTECHECHKAIK
jgi:hypothetical protein